MEFFMFTSWKLGRVRGIDVYLHPTAVLAAMFYASAWGGSLEAFAFVASLFGFVFLHEMGHALMARQYGIETEHITLYPIGGVAALRRMPRSAGPELLIALAGPAVNFALAAGFWAILAIASVAFGVYPDEFLTRLMFANLGLGLFNLLPIFPMDGGRILRALLSGPMGRTRATMAAAAVGQTLAVVGGTFFLINGSIVQAMLALFVYLAAGAERAQVLAESRRANPFPQSAWPEPPFGFRWAHRGPSPRVEPIVIRVVDAERPPTWH